ncbi:Nuclease-related domain-containing protein [Mitsuaria sp. PDC51]|uniref:NERD domain-containing protein n=1 Tax=Mitsuaria sp. PDC51 TaxID=1881035 RepID=UPI0008E77631|nr:NERD domain-containing protein [Mitsuaria sp. PDC51]SFR74861.1 Nuclease-related domain-containing protein [Mitsuaria sp. PDC51]
MSAPSASQRSSQVDVYIGAPIDVASEVEVYRHLLVALAGLPGPFAILANFEASGRQLDFVVCTPKGVLVIEAKSYRWPVTGKENGPWTVATQGGLILEMRNAYRQALDAKNAWKDAVGATASKASGYPDACVMAAFGWPEGSSVPTTEKVSKAIPGQLPELLQRGSQQRLTPKEVAAVAASLGLRRVAMHIDAVDEEMAAARSRIELYNEQFRIQHELMAAQLVDDQYELDGEARTRADVMNEVLKAPGQVVILLGPSGCGKSLLISRLAIDCIEVGFAPLLLQAQDFDGSLKDLIEREVGLLSGSSAKQFLSDVRRLRRPVLVCVDGYNECHEFRQERLTRAVRAFVRKVSSPCVVTSSGHLVRSDLLDGVTVNVKRPDNDLKVRIAQGACGTGDALNRLPNFLDAVGSGLEARLVGEVLAELGDGSSGFALFDTFVRKVLGEHAFEGIAFLARLAGVLAEDARFSTSVREADRLLQGVPTARALLNLLIAKRVLARRGDRMSFGHEQFLRAATAEWAARVRMTTAQTTLETLQSPRLAKSRQFLLGAIESKQLLQSVLPQVLDFELLRAADAGQCGAASQAWIRAKCDEIIARLQQEADVLTFERDGTGMTGVSCVVPNSPPWSEQDKVLLTLVTKAFCEGRYLSPVLDAVRRADAAILRMLASVGADLERIELIKLSEELFAEVVLFGGNEFSLSALISATAGGHHSIRAIYPVGLGEVRAAHWTGDKSLLETYVLLALLKRPAPAETGPLTDRLVDFFRKDWKRSPYHLKLQSLDLAEQMEVGDEARKRELLDAMGELKTNHPFLQHALTAAMYAQGAYDDVKWGDLDQLKAELKSLLAEPEDAEACAAAMRFYMQQFDSPFGDVHYQAWHDQSAEDIALLSAMACRGTTADKAAFCFPSSLIRRAVDAGPSPYVVETISPWLELPSEHSHGPQESLESLVVAHEAFGTMGLELPTVSWTALLPEPAKVALLACARLYYVSALPEQAGWLRQRVLAESREQLNLVGGLHAMAAVATLRWGRSMSMNAKQLPELFPSLSVALAQDALATKADAAWYYERIEPPQSHLLLAIQVLGRFGTANDVSSLYPHVDDVDVGEAALDAIRDIEAR